MGASDSLTVRLQKLGAVLGALALFFAGALAAEEAATESKALGGKGPSAQELRPYATLAEENGQVEFQLKRGMLEAEARLRRLRPAAVMERLGVEPGMSTLEIGAGTGLFAFALAEAVGPGGSVFATEVSRKDLEWLTAEARRRGLNNFESVHVGTGADDPFYASHRFDVVLLSSVLEYLPDPVDYFTTLRPSLTPGTGRVVLIQGRLDKVFMPEDFVFGFRFRRLLNLPEGHPVRSALSPRLLRDLRALRWSSIDDPKLRARLATAFNELLADPALFTAVLAADRAMNSDPEENLRAVLRADELELWRWLYGSFDWSAVGQGAGASLEPRQRSAATELNFLCLVRWFHRGEMSLRFNSLWGFYLSDSSIVQRMEAAGYVLLEDGRDEQGNDFLTNHSFLVFGLDPSG